MHFRKVVSLWALLALMFGQVALAQHSATHIDHGISFELTSSHDSHHHHHSKEEEKEDNETHQCPECVLTKALQTAFYHASTVSVITPQTEILVSTQQSPMTITSYYNANTARAPPKNLI